MARSVAIVGAGQIGRAVALQFYGAGWDVAIHARSKPNWPEFGRAWQAYDATTDETPAADCVVDTIAFDAGDVVRYDPDRVGRLIAVSSASVYCDAEGRTLDEAAQSGFPDFPGAITEDTATVAPGPETYSTRKVRMEQAAGERFGERATILRPCAIHGPWSRHPREWWFVKRLLDGRKTIPFLFAGRSQFQTTSVEQIAALALAATTDALGGVYNVSDTDSPSVLKIGEAIAEVLEREAVFVPSGDKGLVGRTPWSVPKPFRVAGAKAAAATDPQPFDYADHVQPAVHWLAQRNPADWRAAFPQLAAYPWDLFDYAAEDAYLAAL